MGEDYRMSESDESVEVGTTEVEPLDLGGNPAQKLARETAAATENRQVQLSIPERLSRLEKVAGLSSHRDADDNEE
jgi:hypothetical protein